MLVNVVLGILGAAARERAKLFSPEAVMTRWKELFVELIEAKNKKK